MRIHKTAKNPNKKDINNVEYSGTFSSFLLAGMTVSLSTRQYWMAKERSELKNGMYEKLRTCLYAWRPTKSMKKKIRGSVWIRTYSLELPPNVKNFALNLEQKFNHEKSFQILIFFLSTTRHQGERTTSSVPFQCFWWISTSNHYFHAKKLKIPLQRWSRHINPQRTQPGIE